MNLLVWYVNEIILRDLKHPLALGACPASHSDSDPNRATKLEAQEILKNYSKSLIGKRINSCFCTDVGFSLKMLTSASTRFSCESADPDDSHPELISSQARRAEIPLDHCVHEYARGRCREQSGKVKILCRPVRRSEVEEDESRQM